MKFGVVTFPGSNGDFDAFAAVAEGIGQEVKYLWHKERDLAGSDVIILPGGFSYGDYLRAGAIARFSPIMNEVIAHAKRGAPVLAICNGFQVACEAGLLPGALLRNESLKFISRRVAVTVEQTATIFTNAYEKGETLRIPVAHADGRYTADARTLDELESNGRVALRYVAGPGIPESEANANGSCNSIAAILNAGGNVLGTMPHPERAVDSALGRADGLRMFESLLSAVAA